MMKKTFDAAKLREMELPHEAPEGGEIISDRIIGNSRWAVQREVIWRFADTPPGFAWRATYQVGATEHQEEGAWEHQSTVKATLVHEVEKLVKVWDPVPEDVSDG
jgi:hypothetical protein